MKVNQWVCVLVSHVASRLEEQSKPGFIKVLLWHELNVSFA